MVFAVESTVALLGIKHIIAQKFGNINLNFFLGGVKIPSFIGPSIF